MEAILLTYSPLPQTLVLISHVLLVKEHSFTILLKMVYELCQVFSSALWEKGSHAYVF